MTRANIWTAVSKALPGAPLLVGTVTAVYGDGTATVTQPGGGTSRARNPLGSGAGSRVFMQDGAITGPAPLLPIEIIEI